MGAQITITIKLFAIYQETYGTDELQWQFGLGSTVNDVLTRMVTEHPELARWHSVTRFGLNLTFVEPTTELQNGDEVVLIPPVSGG
jgi:molybdopterin synthase sulfur carrier subunit